MNSVVLKVDGMSCGGCSGAVTEAVQGVDGTQDGNVDLDSGIAIPVVLTETSHRNQSSGIIHVEASAFDSSLASASMSVSTLACDSTLVGEGIWNTRRA